MPKWVALDTDKNRTGYGTVAFRQRDRQDLTVRVAGEATVPSAQSRSRYRELDWFLTQLLTLNDPLSQNFTTKWRGRFKTTDGGNGNVYANYHR